MPEVNIGFLGTTTGKDSEEIERREQVANQMIDANVTYLTVESGPLSVESDVEEAWGGVELMPESLSVISAAEKAPPIEVAKDVDADRSTRLDNRHLDVRRPEVRAIFSLRSTLMAAMTEWFRAESFEEVDTPTLSAAGAEGGAELFPVVYNEETRRVPRGLTPRVKPTLRRVLFVRYTVQ